MAQRRPASRPRSFNRSIPVYYQTTITPSQMSEMHDEILDHLQREGVVPPRDHFTVAAELLATLIGTSYRVNDAWNDIYTRYRQVPTERIVPVREHVRHIPNTEGEPAACACCRRAF